MTVTLLREVLDEMNLTDHKNPKKAELVRKVKEARSITIDATQDCDSGSEHTIKSSRKTPKLEWPIAYYYDEKKERLFCLLLHILFLLDTIGAFIEFLVCMYVISVLARLGSLLSGYRYCCFIHYFGTTHAAVVGNYICYQNFSVKAQCSHFPFFEACSMAMSARIK